ncbi:ABC transporter substrate-binding protein [Fodinisporobacter ferrooxydans]|uniref:ABC transporter substrate-binding protein n=1 Tax=Fodinisporobacter ferrooxydans TaxID=2901836 RepID=A0ABY4CMS2_9BACL|nr:ABC transporter substrate-binding protein [Alicyclobacillaceae bacterium MYW30-H2]
MKTWGKVVAATALASLTLTSIVGCGGATGSNASNPIAQDTGKPVDGGTLTLSMSSAPAGKYLPQVWDNEYDQWVAMFTYDTLLEYDKDLAYKPLLAEKWVISDDKKTITWHLNPNAKWTDGQPVTADDLAWTWNWMASKAYNDVIQGPYQGNVSYIEGFDQASKGRAQTMSGIHVIDPHTLSVTLKKPYAAALAILGMTQVLPKHIWANVPPDQYKIKMQDPKMLIGDGPFKITGIKPGESCTYVRNPDYYGGKPHIDKIVWRVVNSDVAAGQVKNGALDEVSTVNPQDADIYKSFSNVTYFEFPSTYFQYLGFKLNNPILKDKNVRHAIAYAINRKGIITGLLKGHGDVLNAPIYATSWANPPADQVHAYNFNIDKAKKLLDDAGYKAGADGFRTDPQGNPFQLTLAYPLGNKVREKTAPIIAKELQQIGLNVKLLAPKDFSAFAADVQHDRDNGMWLMGWGGQIDPDQTGFWSKDAMYNYSHLDSPKEEQLVADAVSGQAFNQDYRKKTMWKWSKFMNDELPWLPLYGERDIFVWNKRLHGVEQYPTVGIFQDVQNWWLSK